MVKTLVVKISHSHCRGCGLELRFHMCILKQKKKKLDWKTDSTQFVKNSTKRKLYSLL